MPDFLEIAGTAPPDLREIMREAAAMKAKRKALPRGTTDSERPLQGHIAALIFEKPSTRTRMSFDVGIRQLGGQSILLSGGDIHLGGAETAADTARIVSRFADLAMIRTFGADSLAEFAAAASVPVVNGLTNISHPCQVMADIMTFEEFRGPIAGKSVAWVGVGTNVCNSFVEASAQFEFDLIFSGPSELAPDTACLEFAGSRIQYEDDPASAVAAADLVVTDAWTSMHDSPGKLDETLQSLLPYQVNEALMSKAPSEALFMHCLPAHRGEEVTSPVLDGAQSVVFDEAENRLHVQKAILRWCLGV
ncbi:MAG: ornithine carbamoyltransferase [Rhodobacteraceae bacterium]|nr:ornithine carbamoyltransferase [Paracoccaceae bacterium]